MSNNITGVETMFNASNRPMPWDDLRDSKSVVGALNSKEAIVAAGLDWIVRPMPVFAEISYMGKNPSMKRAEHYVANVRDKDDRVLGIVTDKYKIVQNTEAFAFTDKLLGGHNIEYETAGSIDDGKRIWLLAKIPAMFKIFDDDIEQYLVFTNTHDGNGSVKVAMTPIRVVCRNTLNLALKEAKRCWFMTHLGNISKKMDMASLTLFNAKNYMEFLKKSAEELNKIRLSPFEIAKIIDYLLPIKEDGGEEHKENVKQRQTDLFNRFLHAPDLQNYDSTGYRLINAVSDYASHQPFYELSFKAKVKEKSIASLRERNFIKNIDGIDLVDKAYKKILEYA